MGLLRLFVVAALIYFLLYLIRSIIRGNSVNNEQVEDAPEQEVHDVHDVLVEDPICHKLLPKKQALRCKFGQDVIYFCSEECCEIFEKSQEEKE